MNLQLRRTSGPLAALYLYRGSVATRVARARRYLQYGSLQLLTNIPAGSSMPALTKMNPSSRRFPSLTTIFSALMNWRM
ncbi:hypothetical protein GQ600_25181 [Phytophthora cactorum]|nr:hypothetical protein GQ600_25181 [Phytophthora cactorum]